MDLQVVMLAVQEVDVEALWVTQFDSTLRDALQLCQVSVVPVAPDTNPVESGVLDL